MARIKPATGQNPKALAAMLAGSGRDKDVSLLDIMQFAEVMATSLHSFFGALDKSLYSEFRDIADAIATMRAEIGKLQPANLTASHLPTAGGQLDAIVRATEDASNSIMESAEVIMAADPSDHEAYVALVNEQMLKVFEACSFQDLTGQRVAKVVTTLRHIEERVSRFATAIGALDEEASLSDSEEAVREREERLMLHGPQGKDEAIKQTEIDELMSGSQADIDSLFD